MSSDQQPKRIIAVGNSHLVTIEHAYTDGGAAMRREVDARFVQLWRSQHYDPLVEASPTGLIYQPRIAEDVAAAVADLKPEAMMLSILGAEHYIWAIEAQERPCDFIVPFAENLPRVAGAEIVPWGMMSRFVGERLGAYLSLMAHLRTLVAIPIYLVLPPPPVTRQERIAEVSPVELQALVTAHGIPDRAIRLKFWLLWCAVARSVARENGIAVIEPPRETVDSGGFLLDHYSFTDAVHANAAYGALVWDQVVSRLNAENS